MKPISGLGIMGSNFYLSLLFAINIITMLGMDISW